MNRRSALASLLIAPGLWAGTSSRSATVSALPLASRVPGGVAVVPIGPADAVPPSVLYGGRRVLVRSAEAGQVAVVGIALAADPAQVQTLDVLDADHREQRVDFELQPKRYAEQRLKVAPRHVELSAQDAARAQREQRHLGTVLGRFDAEREPATLRLRAPVPGRRSSSFGLRRIFNGQPRNPHSGMDLAAATGTPVLSAAAGQVVDVGDYFFSGQCVIVDHGQGFITLYCHLSTIDAAVGDRLEAGTPLGQVGATGRVTGPHLHFSVYLNAQAGGPGVVPAAGLTRQIRQPAPRSAAASTSRETEDTEARDLRPFALHPICAVSPEGDLSLTRLSCLPLAGT